ncbi:hypothetical protein FOZ62_014914, partial [Perkinsus olseni]
YDVRVLDGQEKAKYFLKFWPVDTFLNDQEIQQELGVSKKWERSNAEVVAVQQGPRRGCLPHKVFHAYNKYTAYNTTYFVTSLLDKGFKVGRRVS